MNFAYICLCKQLNRPGRLARRDPWQQARVDTGGWPIVLLQFEKLQIACKTTKTKPTGRRLRQEARIRRVQV